MGEVAPNIIICAGLYLKLVEVVEERDIDFEIDIAAILDVVPYLPILEMERISLGVIQKSNFPRFLINFQRYRILLIRPTAFAHTEARLWNQRAHVTRSGECRFPNLKTDLRREVRKEVERHFGCIWRHRR